MPMLNTPQGQMLLKILPTITFIFMKFQPSALQLYFASTGLWGALQATIINSASLRHRLGLTPFGSQTSQPAAEKSNLELLIERANQERLNEQNRILEARKAKESSGSVQQSAIDKALNSAKDNFRQMSGMDSAGKLKDGSPAPPPRMTESQLRAAQKTEEAAHAEAAAERFRRNEERTREYQQRLLSQKGVKKGSRKGN